jgi:hypothetical protein
LFFALLKFIKTTDEEKVDLIFNIEAREECFYEIVKLTLETHVEKIKLNDAGVYLTGLTSHNTQMRILSAMVLNLAVERNLLDYLTIYEYQRILSQNFHFPAFTNIQIPEMSLETKNGLPSQDFVFTLRKIGPERFEKQIYYHSLSSLIKNLPIANSVLFQCPKKNHLYEKIVLELFNTVIISQKFQKELITEILTRFIQTQVLEFCFSFGKEYPSGLKTTLLGLSLKYFENSSIDFQICLPFVLIGLSSECKQVRTISAKILLRFQIIYEKFTNDGIKQDSKNIYGYDSFYGVRTTKVEYLSISTVKSFVDILSVKVSECISDCDYLGLNLNSMLEQMNQSKKRNRDDVVKFFTSNIIANHSRDFRFLVLNVFENCRVATKIKSLCVLLEEEISSLNHYPLESDGFLKALVFCFQTDGINQVFIKQREILERFCGLFKFESRADQIACESVLNVITHDWFESKSLEVKQRIFSCLINTSGLSDSKILEKTKKCLNEIELCYSIVSPKLDEILKTLEQNIDSKRQKNSEDEQQKVFVLISFLEFMQTMDARVHDFYHLIPKIALVLDGLLNFPLENFTNVEYAKQLVLSTMTNILKSSPNATELTEESLRADLVVQCIRVTDNPQTHNSALLLLSAMGQTHSSIVLVNIMPIFTFMGSNILRQDDNYSFHVVEQTLETIIPSLLKSGDEDRLTYVKTVLDVFVDAVSHVPSHRRLLLFEILIKTVGMEYLGSLIVLLISSPVVSLEKNIIQTGDSVNVKKFSLQLLGLFSREIQLKSLVSIIDIISKTPDFGEEVQQVPAVLDCSVLKTKTIRLIKIHATQFINLALKQMIHNDETLTDKDFVGPQMKLIELHLSKIAMINKKQENTLAFMKYSGFILAGLYENIGTINQMLSLELFLEVLNRLLKNEDLIIQRKSMTMFEERIKTMDPKEIDLGQFENITNTIMTIFCSSDTENKQHALLCLGVLVSLCGPKDLNKYSGIMEVVIGSDGLLNSDAAVYATSMIALSPFIRILGPRCIPYLQTFIPKAFEYIKESIKTKDQTSIVVLKSAFTCINAAIDTIPKFMSSFIGDLLLILGDPMFIDLGIDEISKSRTQLVTSVCENIEHRVLFPIIGSKIEPLTKIGPGSFVFLVQVLKKVLQVSSQKVLLEFKSDWLKLFLTLFSGHIEKTHNQECLIDLFTTFTMKMNEKAFKPLFLKLVEWGTDVKENIEFFFKLVQSLVDNLKSIFVPYFQFILDTCVDQIINSISFTNEWKAVIDSLMKCFQFDNGFVTQERFDKLSVPLVNLLEFQNMDQDFQVFFRFN